MSEIGQSVDLHCGFDEAINRVTAELGAEDFRVISRIDLDKAFPEILGLGLPRCSIFGACNPQLAYQAISATPELSLLLPCNVMIEEINGRTRVTIVDVSAALGIGGLCDIPEIGGLADDANARLDRVAAALTVRTS